MAAARRKNATRESTATLKAWLNEHEKNPCPTKGEKIMLPIANKMTEEGEQDDMGAEEHKVAGRQRRLQDAAPPSQQQMHHQQQQQSYNR